MKAIFITKDGSSQMREITHKEPKIYLPMKDHKDFQDIWLEHNALIPTQYTFHKRRFRHENTWHAHGHYFEVYVED